MGLDMSFKFYYKYSIIQLFFPSKNYLEIYLQGVFFLIFHFFLSRKKLSFITDINSWLCIIKLAQLITEFAILSAGDTKYPHLTWYL